MVNQAGQQSIPFEEFPNEKDHLQELVAAMQDLQSQLRQTRAEFKEQLYVCLKRENPFPTRRGMQGDVSQFIKLVGYCLYAGDMDILMNWGIKPVKKNRELLSSDNYELYKTTFEVLAKKSKEELEKQCHLKLTELFAALANPTPPTDQLVQGGRSFT
jgi:hypothetical protein